MDTLNKRLKYFLFLKNLKHVDVSRQLEINDQQFNNWCNGIKPTIDGLEKIVKYFPDLSARWLLTGDGEPLINHEINERPKRIIDNLDDDEIQQIANLLDKLITKHRNENPANQDFYDSREIGNNKFHKNYS